MIIKKPSCSTVIPKRAIVAIMIFTACLFSYMLRVNMSINLIAMVEPKTDAHSGKAAVPECKAQGYINSTEPMEHKVTHYGVRYAWNQQVQGYILGAYFWGYIITSIPGGLLAERLGPTHVIGVTTALSGLFTILTPISASLHYSIVIVLRFLTGFVGGVTYPALHCLISRWAPPEEKGKFTSALLGGTFGTVITWPILGAVSEGLGWVWAFYLPGIICLVWVISWYLLISDSPRQHSSITEEELKYIESCLGDNVSKTKKLPPYGKIATSIPFWALAILHYGNLWGLYFLLTAGPKFMAEVLGFNLTHSGGLASLPYLARMFLGFIFGSIGDFLRRRQLLTVTSIRKWFIIFSHFLPGVLLLVQTSSGCNVTLSVLLLTMSLGMNGASTVTNLQNSQDLAPNFAGTLYGIVNCIGGTTGFITPILTGYITRDHNGMAEWQIIFTIGATVYIASGIIFCIFGSGDIQPWNNIQEKSVECHVNEGFDIKTENNSSKSSDSKNEVNDSRFTVEMVQDQTENTKI